MKALAVAGTRPEIIKLAPVVKALGCEFVCTGQHPLKMVSPLMDFFEIKDWEWLGCEEGETLSERLADYLVMLDDEFKESAPDVVICQGDTTSALAGALAAFNRQIPVAHVEAGLRTYDLDSPFPEEGNRVLISRLARWHFCPTEDAQYALWEERIGHAAECKQPGSYMVGNTVVDALEWARDKLPDWGPHPNDYILCTVHRRENIPKIPQICEALHRLTEDRYVVVTVHPNPQVKSALKAHLFPPRTGTPVTLLPAPAYPEFLNVLDKCSIVLTDSGGVTEEAAVFGKPCLILRDNTERTEAVAAGCARIVGTDPDEIVENARDLLNSPAVYKHMAEAPNPFGDGHAAERIAEVLNG